MGSFSANRTSSSNTDSSNSILPREQPENKAVRFDILPPEIRIMVWEMTIQKRLVLMGPFNFKVIMDIEGLDLKIEVRFASKHRGDDPNIHDFIADIPVILHVCQESRIIGLKKYELAFFHQGCVAPVYFNFNLDILYPRASCTQKQLEFLSDNMKFKDTSRIRYLAMYNEHLDRTRSVNTWNALPHSFPRLKILVVLFKSFIDPKTIDAKALPACRDSLLCEPKVDRIVFASTRESPPWVKYNREVLKENLRATLHPPVHGCKHKKKGQSRRSHLVRAEIMRRDPLAKNTPDYATDKVNECRDKLKTAAVGLMSSNGPYNWREPRFQVLGLCEHGIEFEEAPGLAYEGKIFRQFGKDGYSIKKVYEAGSVTGTVEDQREAERRSLWA
ncbi:hypothetical protein NHQ30_001684 [Ciborinia camelliae]|nr:hypothetical protein NHQ30_001684 [Ciborinia camelliae]